MEQKKREEDERRLSSNKGSNKSGSHDPTGENDQNPSDFRTDSPPIPTMRPKETDKDDEENRTRGKKVEEKPLEKRIASNRFESRDGPETSQSSKSVKNRGSSRSESEAVVAQLQSMRQGLERKKKMLKEEDLGNEGWDDLE